MSSSGERKVLARGTIRVDARRARAKLREHLLVDLSSYALELARAALGLGATSLDVRWDADDVEIAFDGAPVAPERLARLLDFALTDAVDERAKALRMLALGVNAALGLGAERVDVASTLDGSAWRVRWTPELLDDSESSVPAASVAVPPRAFERGTLVHVRRAWGMGVLKRVLTQEMPREIELLGDATHLAPLTIRVNGAPIVRAHRPPALLRVPFQLTGARAAHVEILPAGSPCSFELHESGVRLLAGAWTPLPGLEARAEASVPARLVVDAKELPTNASRSALREDSALAEELPQKASAAFRLAVTGLVFAVLGEGERPTDVEVAARSPVLLDDALGALVLFIALAIRSGRTLGPELLELTRLPLLHGAAGSRLPVAPLVGARSVHVWRSKQPLPSHLAPWLRDVLVLTGRHVERVLQGVQLLDAKELVARAQSGAATRERLLAHPASEPTVPPSERQLARRKFDGEGLSAGLHGELALLAPVGDLPQQSLLRVYVEQRLIEAIPLEPSFCPLAFDAALAWPTGLRPRFDYDGVERDERLNEAVVSVSLAAVSCASRLATRLGQLQGAERNALESVLRDAVATWSVVPERLGYGTPKVSLRTSEPSLWRARIFPTSEPSRRLSLADLDGATRPSSAICVARDAVGRAVDGRPVLTVSAETVTRIGLALGRELVAVPYDRGLRFATGEAGILERRAHVKEVIADERTRQSLPRVGPVLWLELEACVAAVAPSLSNRVVESHLGAVLRTRDRDGATVPLLAAFDDARTVPSPDWDDVGSAPARHLAPVSGQLAEHLVRALEGEAEAIEALGCVPNPCEDASITAFLVEVAVSVARQLKGAKKRSRQKLSDLATRLEALPLVTVLDPAGQPRLASLAELETKHGAGLPLLRQSPGFETLDWLPVLIRHERERDALSRRFTRSRWADTELETRRGLALQEQRRRALLALPRRELDDLAPMAAAGEPTVRLPATEGSLPGESWEVVVALPRPDMPVGAPWLRVSYEQRPFAEVPASQLGIPLVGALDTKDASEVDALRVLPSDLLERVRGRVAEAGVQLAVAILESARDPAVARRVLCDPRALALFSNLSSRGLGSPVESRLAGDELPWPTIQGGQAPLHAFLRSNGQLWYGTQRYDAWLRQEGRQSDVDAPVLYVPAGPAREPTLTILQQTGFAPFDVSDAAQRLQAQRGGARPAAPILVGLPAHPALRAKAWELGVRVGDGELELVPGDQSDVTVVLLGGAQARRSPTLGCAIRAVLRVDALDESALANLDSELDAAAESLLDRALSELATVPTFVRDAARRAVTAKLARGSVVGESLAASLVFSDSAGNHHSLGELVTAKQWGFTTLSPPFPKLEQPLLLLSDDEAKALTSVVALTRSDRAIERARAGEARRNAAPLDRIALSTTERATCVVTAELRADSCFGEVGVLAPAHLEQRGIALSVDRRPLCRLDDGPGWPLVAAVDDTSVEPNAWFELPRPGDAAKVRARVRQLATQSLQRAFSPPATVLAARWLDDEVCGPFRVTGALWLDSTFRPAPRLRTWTPTDPMPLIRAINFDSSSWPGSRDLPLEGDLMVRFGDGATQAEDTVLGNLELASELWSALTELGVRTALALIADARSRGLEGPGLDEHATSLALLGLDVPAPLVKDTTGAFIDLSRIREELASRGAIWLSDGRGFVEGEMPNAAPSFVLPDDGAPIVRVLESRCPPGSLRRLGGVVPPQHTLGSTSVAEPNPPPAPAQAMLTDPRGSRWSAVSKTLGRWFGSTPEPAGPTSSDELEPLRAAVSELSLAGSPLLCVTPTNSRRALCYRPDEKRVEVAVNIPTVASLVARSRNDHAARSVLAAAAVSEVNRALVEVTDAEERRALVKLLGEL